LNRESVRRALKGFKKRIKPPAVQGANKKIKQMQAARRREMVKKAVDVVLLPNEAMTDKAIEANAELVEKFGAKIVLNKKDCLPHISLAMGCVEEKDIDSVEIILRSIAEKHSPGELTVSGVRTTVNSRGESFSVFEVEKTEELQLLHQEVTEELGPYLSYDVRSDMIYGDEEVSETALLWIANYREKASFDKFFPHITIGYGEVDNFSLPIKFTASSLALCHLGNHCTCRKVLLSFEVKKG
jgi:2'-5' RNA ligase